MMKHLMENKEFRFNEVLFEHRNKEYGAYVLRNESDKILTKALFVGVSLLAAISVTPLIINSFRTSEVVTEGGFELPPPVIIVDTEVPPPPAVIPHQATAASQVRTTDARVPEPKKEVTQEVVYEKIEGAVAGVKNNADGEIATPNVPISTAPTIGTGTVPTIPSTLVVQKEDPSKIVEGDELSVEASYEGGINAFRDKVMNKFDTSGFEDSNGIVKTTVTFIVETNGTISGIKADGKDVAFNSEAARVIKQIKGSWKPGKNKKGQAVRSYFRFPISMKFEN
ncbi:energy transducer TonB [Chryseobacterium fluminis]|uniref:energy transducer TonB n=1 Tax=Chryseobacterium fluminis TaxID=2983606 RepID=UPI00225B06DF|nr:energy transducer TonB [Chryseobacterium sp. MMS21-Ot14]UZT97446.1 energy transducer TonB [Chryseobacterium sp. MMS21-Ot14]